LARRARRSSPGTSSLDARQPGRTRDRGRRPARGRQRVRCTDDDDARGRRGRQRIAAVDPAGVAYLVYSAAAGTGTTPDGAAGISHVRLPGGAFGPPVALPSGFTGAFVFTAGAKVTAVSGGSGGRTLISDWTN
jgi:hypothetical protein